MYVKHILRMIPYLFFFKTWIFFSAFLRDFRSLFFLRGYGSLICYLWMENYHMNRLLMNLEVLLNIF